MKVDSELLNVYSGANVLITGHTGFKGSWLTAWLKFLGANVTGIALDPVTSPSNFSVSMISEGIQDLRIDIRDGEAIEKAIVAAKPDFVFHLAAQALVRHSYDDPVETWQVNLLGTLNVLEALRKINKPCAAVIITSDKCYDNVEWIWGYRENDSLGGLDPYSASKGAAELLIRSHIKSFFPQDGAIRIASARAGNVIGGGDWATDRIIPDCVRAWSQGDAVEMRNPHATRPWQHVLEPLSGYLNLGVELNKSEELHGEPFNFGPPAQHNHSVLELVTEMSRHWDMVRWDDVSELNRSGGHEARLLKLNCDKALHYLNWQAVLGFEETVQMTAEWYRSYYHDPATIVDVTIAQVKGYVDRARERRLQWAL